jgi:predicted nucleic acid-binding protein
MRKAFQLQRVARPEIRILSKLLHNKILADPFKSRFIEGHEIGTLPSNLLEQVPQDDAYLFQAALAGSARTVVTTDTALLGLNSTAVVHELLVRHRNDHLQDYHL